MPIVFTGNVDHGKSTLVARLLLDTGYFPEGRLAELKTAAARRGAPLEISFLLDAFQIERDQAITIDATRIWFASARRRYEIIDAPGHREFVRHMVSGASDAVAAVLVVDAREGIGDQTRRHALLLELVGVSRIVVAVNKMDAVDFDAVHFRRIEYELRAMCAQAGLTVTAVVPTVARDGDNVLHRSGRMPWYDGPDVLAVLDALEDTAEGSQPLRFPVQDVLRRSGERIVLGTVRGGRLESGMTVLFSPSCETARVQEILRFPPSREAASAGEAIGWTLDRAIFVEPGDVASEVAFAPTVANAIEATIFWLDAQPLVPGDDLHLRCGTRDARVRVERILNRIDVDTFAVVDAASLARNDIGDIALRAAAPLVFDIGASSLGRFALYRGDAVSGGGLVRRLPAPAQSDRQRSPNVVADARGATLADRTATSAHCGLVLWLTGLPSSGKTTLATLLEKALLAREWRAYVLDGDTLRTGLNGDLGFSLADRAENVRRTGEVAALFADAGLITIVSLVSPLAAGRLRARAATPSQFHEVFVKADLATCEARDVKGLYRKARAGGIRDFTGINSPYEEPTAPELAIDTTNQSIDAAVAALIAYVVRVASRTGDGAA